MSKVIHLLVRVTGFTIVGNYTLRVRFDDEAERVIDFQPVLHGRLFGPLRDLAFFNQVRLDPEIHTLVWPNDADFDPATLYHWNDGEGEELAVRLAQLARRSP